MAVLEAVVTKAWSEYQALSKVRAELAQELKGEGDALMIEVNSKLSTQEVRGAATHDHRWSRSEPRR